MQKQSIWYKIDYLTSQPSLYIFGQDKLQTKTGLFFSFLVIVLSFSFSIYFLIDFFQRKEPSILYLKESTSIVNSKYWIEIFDTGTVASSSIYSAYTGSSLVSHSEQVDAKLNDFPKEIKVLYESDMTEYLQYAREKYGDDFTSLYDK